MILIFHWFTSILYSLFRKRVNEKIQPWSDFTLTSLNANDHPRAKRHREKNIKFDPPVFKQRYERALDVLMEEKWKNDIHKLIDFGCAEFNFFFFIKNELTTSVLSFVDIDELLLRDNSYRLYPLNADHIVGRSKPLTVNVYAGSISDPDPSLLDTDAVVALEIIEHLYPDTLEALPYNIFSYIKPKLVIVTTPNSDFNVLFHLKTKFRHADHKFEWNREQFQSWATNITLRFPSYTVLFDGIGLGPTGSDGSIGCCSQLAVFIRKDVICDTYKEEICNCTQDICCNCIDCSTKTSYGICTYNSYSKNTTNSGDDQDSYYELIASIKYPYYVDPRTEDEKFFDELKYRLHLYEDIEGEFYNEERNCFQIPLVRLIYKTTKSFPESESEIRKLLLKFNYKIENCLNLNSQELEACVVLEAEMDSGGSGSDTEASGYGSDNTKCTIDESKLSDWDDKDSTWENSTKPETSVATDITKTQLRLEVMDTKKSQGALFDSGYQKSPSLPDESPQAKDQAIAVDFKPLNNDKPNRLSHILSVFDNFDKINELDAVRREKKFFNFTSNLPHREVMKKICQEIARHPIAGPSRIPKKTKQPKKSQSSDSDESVEDVKAITTCILENSLNKIECKNEERRGHLIQEFIEEENIPPVQPEEVIEPILIVENGDLANNNRDLEGNNYPPEDGEDQPQNDNIDNQELNNVNIDNNNEIMRDEAPAEIEVEENLEIEPAVEVAWSSCEAIFDANSQIDLLEDFDMESSEAVFSGVPFPDCCGIADESDTPENNGVPPPEDSSFPNWLLHIFEETEAMPPEDNLPDEPHFYCQGDGLGVHPSVVVINDDADDEGNDSGSESSSSGSVNFANADDQSVHEVFVAPESHNNESLVLIGQPMPLDNQNATLEDSDQEEFANAEESESNLVTSSCTQ